MALHLQALRCSRCSQGDQILKSKVRDTAWLECQVISPSLSNPNLSVLRGAGATDRHLYGRLEGPFRDARETHYWARVAQPF
ncbi:hypothetical protein HOLleu_12498 [Holothuria leucospilota]|uniref:Uncharacterized protein n=1 Tax=Holothuria leucospilota TaxID=206669 RepID=A0A9Q1HDX5_HOLLE|nr:hypothetical protein HOLleu_12498 [Holothuria leucospilota]